MSLEFGEKVCMGDINLWIISMSTIEAMLWVTVTRERVYRAEGQGLELSMEKLSTGFPGHIKVASFLVRFKTVSNSLGGEGRKGYFDRVNSKTEA